MFSQRGNEQGVQYGQSSFSSSILQSTVAGRRWERAKTGLQSISARAFFQGSVQAHISQQSELSHGFPENVFS